MPQKLQPQLRWMTDVEEENFSDAESYLSLFYRGSKAAKLVVQMRAAALTRFKAKDIFRASQLSPLGVSNSHVEKDRKKIKAGTRLSPILLVRDRKHGKVVVADGYHRLCAVYGFEEDVWIPCKIV